MLRRVDDYLGIAVALVLRTALAPSSVSCILNFAAFLQCKSIEEEKYNFDSSESGNSESGNSE